MLTDLIAAVRFSAEAACSVLATDDLESLTSLRLGVELLLRLVNTLPYNIHTTFTRCGHYRLTVMMTVMMTDP